MPVFDIQQRVGSFVAERYELLRMIGEGGMGAVFEAQRHPDGARVAVKLIKPEYITSSEVVARFVQEAQLAAAIGHPNIAQLLDAGEDDEGPFLVLELLHGETLCDVMERRPLGPREALRVGAETLDALRVAHAAGVVHRDIKPENIFLVGGGDACSAVKLLDFGISKILTESAKSGITRVGTAVGTPDYMSPEQASGMRVDPRADLWSLGAVLYQAISLSTPFDGETYQQLLSQILLHPHVPLIERVPSIPPSVSALIDRTLQKEPARRFASADEMLTEVRALLAALPPDSALAPRSDEATSIFQSPAEPTRIVSAPPPGLIASPLPPPPPLSSLPAPSLPAPMVPPRAPSLSPSWASPSSHPPVAVDVVEATRVDPYGPASLAPLPAAPSYRPPAPPEAAPRNRKLVVAITAAGALLAVVAAASVALRSPARVTASLPETPAVTAPSSPEAPPPAVDPSAPVAQPLVQQVLAPPSGTNPAPRPPPERHHESNNGEAPSGERRPRSPRPTVVATAGPPLDLSGIYQGVRPRMSDFHRCMQPAGGNVQFTMDIDHGGAARNVRVSSPPADSPQGRCVLRVVRGLRYPPGRPTSNARVMFTP